MARGAHRSATTLIPRSGKTVRRILIKGLGERDWLLQKRGGLIYYIDLGHSAPQKLLQQIGGLISQTHPKLQKRLDFVVVPHALHSELGTDDRKPHEDGIVVAQGGRKNGKGVLCLWGLDHPADDRNMSLEIIEHELAHVSTDDHSVPSELKRSWERARTADLESQQRLPELKLHRELSWVSGLPRRFERNSPWLNHYPASLSDPEAQIREDWAESISFYLSDRRNLGLISSEGEWLDFSAYYPERSRLLAEWLS